VTLKDSACLSSLFRGDATKTKGQEQWMLDQVRDHNLENGVGNMKAEVKTLLSRQWPEWLANQDGVPDVRPSIARVKEYAGHIRCLQADVANEDGVRLVHGLNVSEERVDKWAADVEANLATEQACRASGECMAQRVGPQVCPLLADRDDARRQIAAERANPAGVVSLSTLHDLGEKLQYANDTIAKLKAQYAKLAKRAFNEGACR